MDISPSDEIATPYCHAMMELPSAAGERVRLNATKSDQIHPSDPISIHISHGLAYTIGSALGSTPPSTETCLAAFTAPNQVGLTVGARAWSKHHHRPQSSKDSDGGWWGNPFGPVEKINENALLLFWRIMGGATWRNLHWLPHEVLVYEVRVAEGYGMRWSQAKSQLQETSEPWIFRGYVEPMMENGHELGWKHT